jgi:hypothetical protein
VTENEGVAFNQSITVINGGCEICQRSGRKTIFSEVRPGQAPERRSGFFRWFASLPFLAGSSLTNRFEDRSIVRVSPIVSQHELKDFAVEGSQNPVTLRNQRVAAHRSLLFGMAPGYVAECSSCLALPGGGSTRLWRAASGEGDELQLKPGDPQPRSKTC